MSCCTLNASRRGQNCEFCHIDSYGKNNSYNCNQLHFSTHQSLLIWKIIQNLPNLSLHFFYSPCITFHQVIHYCDTWCSLNCSKIQLLLEIAKREKFCRLIILINNTLCPITEMSEKKMPQKFTGRGIRFKGADNLWRLIFCLQNIGL